MGINNFAKTYVQKNFNKKLGRKKLSQAVKDTIKLCSGNSVTCYSKFLLTSKNITINKDNPIYLNNYFDQFFQPIKINQNYSQNLNMSLTTIQHLDYLLTKCLKFNTIPSDNM